jgi:hypothetical protein
MVILGICNQPTKEMVKHFGNNQCLGVHFVISRIQTPTGIVNNPAFYRNFDNFHLDVLSCGVYRIITPVMNLGCSMFLATYWSSGQPHLGFSLHLLIVASS